MSTVTNDSQFGWSSEIVSGEPVNLPPPFGLSMTLSISVENRNQISSFGQTGLTLTLTQKPDNNNNIEALLPKKLNHSDYYTKPTIQELAAKERADPGYCVRVKDFIFGRTSVGSVKFLGETDVRGVDLESCIQFFQELVIFRTEKRPAAGQRLGTAEVTLVKKVVWCREKWPETRARLNREAKTLKNRVEAKGGEYVSYEPILDGDMKFRFKYISGSGVIRLIPKVRLALRIKKMLNGFFS